MKVELLVFYLSQKLSLHFCALSFGWSVFRFRLYICYCFACFFTAGSLFSNDARVAAFYSFNIFATQIISVAEVTFTNNPFYDIITSINAGRFYPLPGWVQAFAAGFYQQFIGSGILNNLKICRIPTRSSNTISYGNHCFAQFYLCFACFTSTTSSYACRIFKESNCSTYTNYSC